MDATPAADEERELWLRFVASRDQAVRLQIVDAHLPFARMLAAQMYSRRGGLPAEFADYLQTAVLGLIEAVDRFDPGRGIPFRHYAVRRIRGAVLDALPSLSELHTRVLTPGGPQDRSASFADRIESLIHRDDDKEIPLLSLEDLADFTVELSIGFMLDDEEENKVPVEEVDLCAYEDAQRRELANLFAWMVPKLAPELARIVRYHYFFGIDFRTIAQMLVVTPARVSQLHGKALKALRKLYQDGRFGMSA